MLRLVHYLSVIDLEHGGVVRAVLDMCRLLAQRGHDVALMTWDAKDVPPSWTDGGPGLPRVVHLARPTLPGDILSRAALSDVDEAMAQCDLVHLHVPWDRANVQIARLARKRGLPYVVTTHGMLDDWPMLQRSWKKWLYNRLFGRRLLERAAVVQCTAEPELEKTRKWLGGARAVVVPYMFDFAPFERPPGPGLARRSIEAAAAEEPRVLFLSRLHAKKGAELLIEAVADLRQRGLAFRLLLAGPGDDPYVGSLKELAASQGLADRVAFLGMVQGDLKVSLFEAADLFVLPTQQENFGIVLLEAMACGTPVITTRGVKIWSELEQCGALIVNRTPRAFADAIEMLLRDTAERQWIGKQCRKRIFEAFAPDRIAGQYETMYGESIGRVAPS